MAQITLNSTGVASSGALVLQSNGTTTAVTINASQGVEFNAGTAALPAITTTGDTNTGIFFPAADTIAFSEGGVEAARFDSAGNLGIGTSNPSARLTSKASGNGYANSAGLSLLGAVSGTSYITNIGGALYVSNDGSTDHLVLNSSGNLGLGVTPSAFGSGSYKALQIGGSLSFMGRAGGSDSYVMSNTYFDQTNYRYTASLAASRYTQSGGEHQWFNAPSGTAGNTISFTQAMTLDASGNLGVGTTSPTAVSGYKIIESQGSLGGIFQTSASGNSIKARFYSTSSGGYIGTNSNDFFVFITNDTERARIDTSGNLMVGNTNTAPGSGNTVTGCTLDGGLGIGYFSRSTDSSLIINTNANGKVSRIYRSGSEVGDITVTTTTTSFNSTSDYRLKTVLGAVSDSGSRIDALEPIEYTWNSTNLRTRGFLAHKFQEVYANSVTGTKDAIDANGNPEYQSMQASTSEVIADLVAEIQSLRKRLAALESA